jgi:hypothetical protein
MENWITEDVETGFPLHGETDRYDCPSSRLLQLAWQEGIINCKKWHEPGKQALDKC